MPFSVRTIWTDLLQDLSFALHQFRRRPGFLVLVTATLAIGIGANSAMASILYRILLQPPANVREPQHVVRLLEVSRNAVGRTQVNQWINYPTLLDIQRSAPAFSSVGAYTVETVAFGSGSEATSVRAWLVSPDFFKVLGINATTGRVFSPDDGFPDGEAGGGPTLAVLGHAFWQRRFGGSSEAIGQVVRIGAVSYTIVGIAPKNYRGTEAEPADVYLPLTVAAPADEPGLWFSSRGSTWLALIGRVNHGVSHAVAAQQATAVFRHGNAFPGMDSTDRLVAAPLNPGRGPDAPRDVKIALWLGVVSGIVLLIACANVANLLVARALSRRSETTIRLALGASRSRLARQLLTEGLLMSAMGASAAVWLSAYGSRLLEHLFVATPVRARLLDGHLLAFAALAGLGTAVLVSLTPILQTTTPDLTRGLRSGTEIGNRDPRLARTRWSLMLLQAALCLVLLVGAAIFTLSMNRVNQLDLGMDVAHTARVNFDLNALGLTQAEAQATLERISMAVKALPGVQRLAFASGDPNWGGVAVGAMMRDRGETETMRRAWQSAAPLETAVDSGFFRTVGATSLRGRDFESTDLRGSPRVAIVTSALAHLLSGDGSVLRKCILLPHWRDPRSNECVTVVGVVDGYWKRDILDRDVYTIYVPLTQSRIVSGGHWMLYVRTIMPAAVLGGAIHAAVQRAQPQLRGVRVQSMREVLAPQYRPWEFGSTMFTLFGFIALVIAAVGLYGVVAFNAAQRTPELAVRMVLGARRRDVLMVVAGDGLLAVAAGLVIGMVIVIATHRWIDGLLFHVSASDPLIIGASAGVLLFVGIAASLIPTGRALLKNPAEVLRAE